MKLVDPIKSRGHHVYMDNYYTSPQLFSDLRASGFGACGTVRLNRRGLPAAVKENVRKGETKAIQMDATMLLIKWMDKRAVTALTTIHPDREVAVERRSRRAVGGRETVMKPHTIVEYNKYMGGVDVADQLLSYYGFGHRTVKWWRRAFFFLLDMAVVNSYILYTVKNPDKRRRLTHEQFRVTLATDLHAARVDPGTGSDHHGPVDSHSSLLLGSRNGTFPSLLESLQLVGHYSMTAPSAAERREGKGRQRHTSVGSAIFLCVLCPVLSCTTPKGTHRDTLS